jgi:hypothetical protein
MPHYQQSDSLSTTTDVPLSGTGTSTPEAPAGNDEYSAWQWEAVLATVLDIPIPDRSEVTGQSWLTIGHDGQGNPGSHLIWTAGWNASQNSGATSIQVYLNPALYTAGGAWDRFLNTPPQALSGVPSREYAGLPLVPPSFDAASFVMDSATNFWDSAAQQLALMHQDAISGSFVGFQGNLAGVVGDLLGHLRTVAVQLHEQLTQPVRYSDSIETAGGSAVTFLNDLLSARSSWTQLVEHSPLGAVVTVLEQIATKDANGAFVIPDPQNTPYGDLTIDASWAVVEQHARNLWMGTLTGGTAGFTGLDLLGRTALSKMVNQFAVTTSALVPVVGPAPPSLQPNPVNPKPNGNGPGNGNGNGQGNVDVSIPPPNGGNPGNPGPPPSGGGGPGSPGSPPPLSFLVKTPGPNGPNDAGGGPPGVVGSAGGPAPVPPGGNQNLTGFPPLSVLFPSHPGPPGLAGSISSGRQSLAAADGGEARLPSPAGSNSLSNGLTGNLPTGLGQPGFNGTIGRPPGGKDERRRRKDPGGRPGSGGNPVTATPLTAPVAGFSLGRGLGGVVIERSVVPTMAARPPAVTSSQIRIQPVQVPGDTNPASAAGPPAAPVPGTHVPAEGRIVVAGDGSVLAPEMAGANEPIGTGEVGGEGVMTMPPMGGLGGISGAGGAGPGRGPAERHRLAYLPQEPGYWGTEPDLVTSLGAAAADDDTFTQEDFDSVPPRIAGLGARSEAEQRQNAATDWRTL